MVSVLACLAFAHFLAGAALAQRSETSKFGAWETQCSPSTNNVKVCALVQKAMSEEQPNVGLMVAVRRAPGMPNGVIQIFAPAGTFLLEGVGIKVDEVEFPKLPFFRCTQITCAAEGPISNDLMSKMLNGKHLLITIYVNPGEGLRHIFTLDGFKDGYNALRE
ncbi:invasion associated locus B family protein [Methylocystis hirsuta]|uniref:invasion associated locus B family protein n=1 Tax=Methylocystis hirsuta TaxID=369798 RepID=UPI0014760BFE|nr:invasion associated locus B family protein [Methylocystis hirsuta]